MSIPMALVKWMLKQRGQMMAPDFDVQSLRASTQDLSRFLPADKKVNYTSEVLAGHQAELAVPENPYEDAVIVHIHGGGFVSGSAQSSRPFTSFLSQQAKRRVYSLDYRLAPEHPFPAAVNDCYDQFRALADKYPHKKIALIGESAGAMLVMVVALMARDQSLQAPVCVVANAPGADLTQEVDRPKMNQTDLVLSHQAIKKIGELYCPEDAHNPYASLRFADFRDFPPLRIVWDAGEHLAYDGRILAEKAQADGVSVEIEEYQHAFHAFQILGKFLPEAREDIQKSIGFMEKHIGSDTQ